MIAKLLVLAVCLLGVGEIQRVPLFKIRVPSAGTGSGCTGACLFETSFTSTNKALDGSNSVATCSLSGGGTTTCAGWTQDASQWIGGGGPCSGYAVNLQQGQQAGVKISSVSVGTTGDCDAVIASANYANGAGGRAFRQFRSNGVNNNSGVFKIDFGTSVTELWLSYVMRWTSGYTWSGGNPSYTKDWYFDNGGSDFLIFGHQGGAWGLNVSGAINYPGTTGANRDWTGMMGSASGDGLWHCFDHHVDVSTGTIDTWVDGVKTQTRSGVSMSSFTSFQSMHPSNQSNSTFDGYSDYDDIRADTGLTAGTRIGCPGF